MIWVILVLVGFVGGTIGSLVGLGGGIIIVPSLLFLGNGTDLIPPVSPQVAVGTSILIIIVTGLAATLSYIKLKKVDYVSGLIFFLGSGPGAYVGALINKSFGSGDFTFIFGIMIIFISLIMSVTKHIPPLSVKKGMDRTYVSLSGDEFSYKLNPVIAVVCCFFIGIMSGFFGIGGGSLLVPLMLIVLGFPAAVAIPTSMFVVFLSSIVGSVAHIRLGNVDWLYALALIPGAWFGGKFGSFLNHRLNEKVVVLIFRLLLVIIGLRMMI